MTSTQIKLKAVVVLMLALSATQAIAYDFMVDGLCYNINADGASVSVTRQSINTPSAYSNLSGSLEIPSAAQYNGTSYPVTAIDGSAFYRCSDLTSVAIPRSVIAIGAYAFASCSSLTSVTIPSSVSRIDGYVFLDCTDLTSIKVESGNKVYDSRGNCNAIIETASNTLITGCKSSTIPGSVTAIGNGAFTNCSGLKSVTIPGSVTTIGVNAFQGCSGLTSVTIPSSVTSISDYVFAYCTDLTTIKVESGNKVYDSRDNCNAIIETASNTLKVGCKASTIPGTVTTIGSWAFYGCSGLTSVTIPGSVTTIGTNAFTYCSGLTGITIPSSVYSLGENVFSGCSGLESISVESGNKNFDSRNNCNAIIETASNTLIQGCNNSVIPSSVTKIGRSAFVGCSGLTSIILPNSLTEICDYAFSGCSGLTKVTLVNGLSSIGSSAFEGCSSLTSINIPASVTSIGGAPFLDCGLVSITVESSNKYYDSRENCNALIETATSTLIQGCNNSFIPNSVKAIGYFAFLNCQNLAELTLPSSLESIGNQAFYNCTGLRKITALGKIPAKLEYNVWEGVNQSQVELDVLPECVSIYKYLNTWKNFRIVAVNGQGSTSKILCAFFENTPYWWGPINCYTWNKNLGDKTYAGSWPGTQCVAVGATDDGVPIWMWYGGYVGDDQPTGIIFNIHNGNVNNQTADFEFINGGVYNFNGFIRSIYFNPGDSDGNGMVNGSDVTALYNLLLNGVQPAGDADVDGNGVVNGSDVTALYNLLLAQ